MPPLLEYGCLLRQDQLIYYNQNVLIYIQLQKGLCDSVYCKDTHL